MSKLNDFYVMICAKGSKIAVLDNIKRELSRKKSIKYDGAGNQVKKGKIIEKCLFYVVKNEYGNMSKLSKMQKKYKVKVDVSEMTR